MGAEGEIQVPTVIVRTAWGQGDSLLGARVPSSGPGASAHRLEEKQVGIAGPAAGLSGVPGSPKRKPAIPR